MVKMKAKISINQCLKTYKPNEINVLKKAIYFMIIFKCYLFQKTTLPLSLLIVNNLKRLPKKNSQSKSYCFAKKSLCKVIFIFLKTFNFHDFELNQFVTIFIFL